MLDIPLITIYSRILSNENNTQIEGYSPVWSKELNYGSINGITGGESSYVIEFDIWNNEPAYSGGMLPVQLQDAVNCEFSVWDNESCTTYSSLIDDNSTNEFKSYIRARNVSQDIKSDFVPILGPISNLKNENMIGSLNKEGTLSGTEGGDHMVIQTKIVVSPQNEKTSKGLFFSFKYSYE